MVKNAKKKIRSDPPQKKNSFKRVSETNCSWGVRRKKYLVNFALKNYRMVPNIRTGRASRVRSDLMIQMLRF